MEIKAQSDLTVPEVASLAWNADVRLNLDRIDTAFLTTLKHYMDINAVPQVAESDLREIYSIVSELAGESNASLAIRTTTTIARLDGPPWPSAVAPGNLVRLETRLPVW